MKILIEKWCGFATEYSYVDGLQDALMFDKKLIELVETNQHHGEHEHIRPAPPIEGKKPTKRIVNISVVFRERVEEILKEYNVEPWRWLHLYSSSEMKVHDVEGPWMVVRWDEFGERLLERDKMEWRSP